ncbi:MAG: S49 family peptidase [Chloroflexota bacterium]
MAESDNSQRSPLRLILTVLFIVILPLAVGLWAAPRVVPKPKVGVARLSFDIFDVTAFEITEQLAYARQDPSIEAVVLIINSPGGEASASEELFFDVLNTREEMPVIAAIDLVAASGAYYMAAAADEIYAKPTSFVGSVGVIASLPGEPLLDDSIVTTGPYKSFGGTRDGFVRGAERSKFSFLEAIRTGRGDKLTIDLDFLSRAEIFRGLEALEFGLIDGLMSKDEAGQRAAELAGLADYELVELYPLTFPEQVGGLNPAASYQPPQIDAEKLLATPTDLPAGLYYRYMELP